MLKAHRFVAATGILALLFAACGPAATPAPTATPQPTPTSAPLGQATPAPTRAAPTATPAPSPTLLAAVPRTGGKLRVQAQESTTMDVHALATGGNEPSNIFEPLLRINFQRKLDPALAESWSAPDPTTLIFKLRKGVVFHDGSPFNAQVAKWNLDRILNPETVSPFARQSISSVDKVEVVDDYTLRLRLKKPDSALPYYLGMTQLSMIAPTSVEKWGKDMGTHPVGTGPYVFQMWAPASRITMTRNPSYWDSPKPYIQDIEWVMTMDSSVILASLLTGALDVAIVGIREHLDRLEKTPGMKIYPSPNDQSWGFFLNHLRPPLNNLDLRRALDLALDREAIVKALMGGRGAPAASLFGPADPEFNATLTWTKRDVAKARELVAKSGYKGQTLDLASWPYAFAPQLAEIVQAQFKEIGVNVQITVYPSSAAYVRVLGQLLYDIGTIASGHFPLEYRATIYFHKDGRINMGRFADTPEARKLTELIDSISSTYDWDTRKRLFDELQKVVYDNAMDIYIMTWKTHKVARDRVLNYQPPAAGNAEWLAEMWLKD